jgi:signal transduction histidine kinase
VSALLLKTLRSTTFKLALMSILIFGVMVVAIFSYVYRSTASYLRDQSDRSLEVELAALKRAYDDTGREGLIRAITQHMSEQRLEGGAYLLAGPSFVPLAGNLQTWPSAAKGASGWSSFREGEGKPSLRAAFETLPDGAHLLVGQAIEKLDAFEREIDTALAVTLLLVFVLAGVATVSVTRRTVGRIESINATSRAIMESGLGRRIPLRGVRDEWDELAANLNSMLDRIEALMGEVKQVTDNVAHDLRTPLARMRGRLEMAYHQPGRGQFDEKLIGDMIADLDDVLRMFSSVMRISQIEAYDRTTAFHSVNLLETAKEVAELFDAAAEEKGVRLEVRGDRGVLIAGERDLLFDAMANVVDNAIKYGGKAGDVVVDVMADADGAVFSVADHGPGIPDAQRQQVFKRFYRLERTCGAPGNGLGLSLVAAVARLHGASVELLDNSPGLKVCLHFPSRLSPKAERVAT